MKIKYEFDYSVPASDRQELRSILIKHGLAACSNRVLVKLKQGRFSLHNKHSITGQTQQPFYLATYKHDNIITGNSVIALTSDGLICMDGQFAVKLY